MSVFINNYVFALYYNGSEHHTKCMTKHTKNLIIKLDNVFYSPEILSLQIVLVVLRFIFVFYFQYKLETYHPILYIMRIDEMCIRV